MEKTKTARLVKPQELNHHGTLFAGRMAEWFVESCFICAAKATGRPENIVCINVHGLTFKTPANNGEIVEMENRIVRVGKTSFTVYGEMRLGQSGKRICEGFASFVFVDEQNRPQLHGLVLDETTEAEELELRRQAQGLKN